MNRLAPSLALLALPICGVLAADSVVVFNEVHYHPAANETANEWVELHNQMAIDIDLSAWSITGGIGFTFAEGTVLPGGGYLVITSDPTALQAATGLTTAVGPYSGRLNNAGDLIRLRDHNGRLMDELEYRDGGKWPVAPDGSGATLAKRDPNTTSGPPEHWTSSVLAGGTPGARNFPAATAPLRRALVAFNALWRYEASGNDLGTAWREPGFDDSAWAGRNNATLVAYWPFDGNATATRGVSGTFVGAVSATSDRNGTAGGALAFNGAAQQYVNVVGGGGLNGAGAGAISLWVKWSGAQDADCCGSFGAVLARQGNGLFSDNIIALNSSDPNSARVVWRQSGGPAPVLITGTTVVGTTWHHIAVTFANTGSTLFVDGIPQGTAVGAGLNNDSSVPLSIGAWAGDGAGFSTASIDDVAIWDQPLTPAQIAQLAAQTRRPLDFAAPESAVYFAGDGRLTSNDDLRRTALPLGPTTYYFRNTFQFGDDPAHAELTLDLAVDDGAVFYLNGVEVSRHNMPAGAVSYATLAASEVGDAPILNGISLPASSLVRGSNVLAVEVHQAAVDDAGMTFGSALTALITPLGTVSPELFEPGGLVLNEISAASARSFQIELMNRGSEPLDIRGGAVQRTGTSADAEYLLSSQILAPGGFLVLDQTALDFSAAPGDKLFLFRPGKRAVADALEVHERPRARSPDGVGEWLTPSTLTLGASNSFALHDEVVINEIMYHAPPALEEPAVLGTNALITLSTEQWIELFNRSSHAVDLTGWRLDEGIDFRFASNTVISPRGYLVVAKAPAILQAKFPGIAVVGPYTNNLSRRGERLVLKDAADNPADTVHYFDDGRWPKAADGGGGSLELRDPYADNAAGEAWAASQESSRSTWRSYSYRGVAAASPVGPDGQWREFVMGLLDRGVVLLDDISVIESPNMTPAQLIQNGTFETGTNRWRIIGNQHGEVIDDPDEPGNKALRLVATGATEHMSNHAETTLAGGRDVVNGREYLVSFRAKWISGSRQFHTRLYFNRLPRTTLLDAPTLHGTPGAQNSTFTPNIGPTYSEFRHHPPVPAPLAPVTVAVQASDPHGVSAMTLWWRVDGRPWESVAMVPHASRFTVYEGALPGKAAGTIVQFYVEGVDGLGAGSTFPAAGPNSRALYEVDDGLAATNGLHNLRLIMLTADSDQLFRTANLMSNGRLGSTVIYDERDIFYEAGLRLKGSEHSRTTTPRLGFNVAFTSGQRFRGVHDTVAIDRSESTGFGQREMLIHQTLNHAGGVTSKYHDLIQVLAPRFEYTGSAELQLARYTDVFLDDQFQNGSDGTVFEYELVYQFNSTDTGTPEGNKVPAPDSVVGTSIRNLGDDKEGYRWSFLIKNNQDRDDYSRLMEFCKAMERSGTNFTSQITNYIDVDHWLRGMAVTALSGAGDNYGGDGAQHNAQFYVRPSDGRVLYFPHDVDAFFSATRPIVPNNDTAKLMAVPAWARAYYGHLLDIMATTYNGNYLARWAEHFGRLLPAQDFSGHLAFLVERANFVSNQVKAAVPNVAFSITSNGGNDFGTTNGTISLTGTAPMQVKYIEVSGVRYPVTWTSTTAWSLRLPLRNGRNALTVQGVAHDGSPLSNAVATITITNNGPGAFLPVVINEWMADNAGPDGFPDPADGLFQDWFELFNPNTNAVNLSGFWLTDNPDEPAKWPIPPDTLIGPRDFLLVWADRQTEQNGLGGHGHLHAGFQLNNNGEAIGLFNPSGVAQHIVLFGRQVQNVSQGLFPDGATNSFYFMTNWTPRAANSLAGPLRLTGVSFQTGLVTLTWSAVSGHTYRVYHKDSLDAPAWAPLGGDVLADGNTASATDTLPKNAHRFYRVGRVSAPGRLGK